MRVTASQELPARPVVIPLEVPRPTGATLAPPPLTAAGQEGNIQLSVPTTLRK